MKYAVLILLFAITSHAQNLRERVKTRMLNKLQNRPAPEITATADSNLTSGKKHVLKVSHDDLDRYYSVYVPKKYDAKKPAPLLFVFHGGGGNMEIQSTEKFYKQISKSEEAGFIVVFPNGYSKFQSGVLATWNAGNCCGDARDKKVDDVGFIRLVLDTLSKQLNVDRNRIFATGMSNGAMMSYRLACEMPETFKAIAAVAGTDNTTQCYDKKISILHIHAKDDDHVLFHGGIGPSAVEKSKITKFNSVPSTISKWVKINGCSEVAKKVNPFCEEYTDCKENKKVRLCVTPTGGHSWPGGKKPRGTTEPFKDFSATDAMWDFFNSL